MSDSDVSESEANLPTAAECEARCQEFAAVTGTDTALAQFYLQDMEWNVEVLYMRGFHLEKITSMFD